MSPTKLLLVALLAVPAWAEAQTVDASAITRLSGRQDPRDGEVHTIVPAYEDVWLRAADLGVSGIDSSKIVISAWGLIAGGDPLDGDHLTGDVDLAFVEGKLFERHLSVRLGRQLVSSGVARNLQLDGGDVVASPGGGVGVEVYGGVPTAHRFEYSKGQGAVGGRLFWRPAQIFEGGVSFVDVLDDGRTDRQELGVDARLYLGKQVTLSGLAAFSTVEERLAEGTVRALWQPKRTVELGLEYSRVAPDLFVSRASIFSVFAEESRDEAGATIYFRPLPRLRIYGDGYVISDESGTGGRADLRLAVSVGEGASQVGVEGRTLYVPANGYAQARAFAIQRLARDFVVTADVDYYALRDEVNGQSSSFTGAATLAWDFARGWRALATGVAGVTPLLESRFEAMGKLVYNFDYRATARPTTTATTATAQAQAVRP